MQALQRLLTMLTDRVQGFNTPLPEKRAANGPPRSDRPLSDEQATPLSIADQAAGWGRAS
jgi:hypothetical protein